MPDIDPELVETAIRWCAEAGRQATPALIRAALAPLSWDQLLAARALLADPPPIRPLGAFALADIARGAPADVAAERERAGRYAAAANEAAESQGSSAPAAPPPRPAGGRGRKRARPPFVVRRASETRASDAPGPRALPLFDELLLEEGRAVLERLIRRHGGKRARLAEAITAGWRRPDGQPTGAEDLDRALAHHGMARAYELRERDEYLHAIRAAGGVLVRAAAEVGLDRAGLEAALDRLGARAEAEKIREQKRQALRARGTLTQRTHLLLDETERLADLGLLEEFSRDLAARLPDHLRALTAGRFESVAEALGQSLSLDPRGVERLLQHTGVRLDQVARASSPSLRAPATGRPERRPPRPRSGGPRPTTEGAAPRERLASGARRPPGGPPRKNGRTGGARGGPPRKNGGPGGARGGPPRSGGRPAGRGGGTRPPKRR